MAFSATNKLKICKILGVNSTKLNERLEYFAAYINAEVETQVVAEIERWDDGAGTKFIWAEPNVKNFGGGFDPEREKRDIRNNIAILLFFEELIGNSESFVIERG